MSSLGAIIILADSLLRAGSADCDSIQLYEIGEVLFEISKRRIAIVDFVHYRPSDSKVKIRSGFERDRRVGSF